MQAVAEEAGVDPGIFTVQDWAAYTPEEHETWGILYERRMKELLHTGSRVFLEGAETIGLRRDCVPELADVNRRLGARTGWRSMAVRGFIPAREFFGCLAQRMFPTQEALNRAIRAVRPGRQVNVLGRVIESYAKRFGYGVVRDYTGHGVHSAFHSGLVIPHYDEPFHDTIIEPGMTFTIEPMINAGRKEVKELGSDGWTIVTKDHSLSAQWEHTVLVTEDGYEVLTQSAGSPPPPAFVSA